VKIVRKQLGCKHSEMICLVWSHFNPLLFPVWSARDCSGNPFAC